MAELDDVFDDLHGAGLLARRFDGGPDALAALKNLTSELVGRFCVAVIAQIRDKQKNNKNTIGKQLVKNIKRNKAD